MSSRRQSLQTPSISSNYLRNLSPGPSSSTSSYRPHSPSRYSPTRSSPAPPPLSSLISSSPLSNYVSRYGSTTSATARNYLVAPFYTPPSRSRSLVNRISNRINHSEVLRNLPPVRPVKSVAQKDRDEYERRKNELIIRRQSDIGPRIICLSDNEADDDIEDEEEYEDEDWEDEEEWEDEDDNDDDERENSPEIVTKVPQLSKAAVSVSRTIPIIPNGLKKIPENSSISISPPKVQAPPRVYIDQIKPTTDMTARKPPTVVARDLACREKTPAPMGTLSDHKISNTSSGLKPSSTLPKTGTSSNTVKSVASQPSKVSETVSTSSKQSQKTAPPVVATKPEKLIVSTSTLKPPVNPQKLNGTTANTSKPATTSTSNTKLQAPPTQKPSTSTVSPPSPKPPSNSTATTQKTTSNNSVPQKPPASNPNSDNKPSTSSDKNPVTSKPVQMTASKPPPLISKPSTSSLLQSAAEKLSAIASAAKEEEEEDEEWEDESEWEDEEEEFSDPEDAKAFEIVHQLIQKYQESLQYGGGSSSTSTAYPPVASNQRIVSSGVASVSSSHLNGATPSSNGQLSNDYYKRLYEQEKSENEKLKKKIDEMNASNLTNGTSRSRNITVFDDEKKALERKVQQLEYELEKTKQLQSDYKRLKDENGALIRVISKLSTK